MRLFLVIEEKRASIDELVLFSKHRITHGSLSGICGLPEWRGQNYAPHPANRHTLRSTEICTFCLVFGLVIPDMAGRSSITWSEGNEDRRTVAVADRTTSDYGGAPCFNLATEAGQIYLNIVSEKQVTGNFLEILGQTRQLGIRRGSRASVSPTPISRPSGAPVAMQSRETLVKLRREALCEAINSHLPADAKQIKNIPQQPHVFVGRLRGLGLEMVIKDDRFTIATVLKRDLEKSMLELVYVGLTTRNVIIQALS